MTQSGRPSVRRGGGALRVLPAILVAILPLCLIAAVVLVVQLSQADEISGSIIGDVTCAQAPPEATEARHFPAAPSPTLADHALWTAVVETSCGRVEIQLDGLVAPQTVASFVFLARHDYWRDSPCHRITTERTGVFLLQCGDPTGTGLGNPGYSFGIENAPAGGEYPRGTVAMARDDDPDSNGSQFFIFYRDTVLPSDTGGYSIFGAVTEGMDVIDAVASKGAEDGVPDFHPFIPLSLLSVHVFELR